MGLDMYLKAKLFTSKYTNKEINAKLWKFAPFKPIENIDTAEISFEAAYWRKANAIHKWFVDNCQDGNDNGESYWVSREQIRKLIESCKRTIKVVKSFPMTKTSIVAGWKDGKEYHEEIEVYDVDEEKIELKTQSGFFFGSLQYDKWYIKDLERTIKMLEECLKIPEEWDFEYYASW